MPAQAGNCCLYINRSCVFGPTGQTQQFPAHGTAWTQTGRRGNLGEPTENEDESLSHRFCDIRSPAVGRRRCLRRPSRRNPIFTEYLRRPGIAGPDLCFGIADFSREAATAHSRGRQPTERNLNEHVSREAATADVTAVAASRLGLCMPFFCGLTPAAMCCRRFATQKCETFRPTTRNANVRLMYKRQGGQPESLIARTGFPPARE